jgi:single-strand DNA-binding protein
VILIGHLGRDAETRFSASGAACTTFSIATSRRYKPADSQEWKEETDWHSVVLWRNEKVAEYLTRGKLVYIEGRLQTRSYEKDGVKRYVTEVVATDLVLMATPGGARPPVPEEPPQDARAGAPVISDDDVPF